MYYYSVIAPTIIDHFYHDVFCKIMLHYSYVHITFQ